ncbi:E3 ubiquitin-protein ligase TRIM7-like [Heteronotia binoei]|uniref:E3 ubiquitin-protein ligase TRIM7-like n=1 Tax=Heteronotia binoei TaxID=13085 RepID=UPI00292F8EA0|nr:E3 ubiquitin-protein ligase TRIM7-like [Heteronotia binoei]
MAEAGPVQELCEELSCPICLLYFRDPVCITECGHNFCRGCLARSWEEWGAHPSCPLCKQPAQPRNIKPNRQLANVVEIAKKLSLQGERKMEAKERVCEKHQEHLKLFCKDDEAPICVVCDRSKEHRDHRVVPVEEAAQEYQEEFCHRLDILRKEREKILACTKDAEQESQDLLTVTRSEMEKTLAEFRKLHQFLEEQEQLLLDQMVTLEKEIARERDEHVARLSWELFSLESLIQEVEEKIQQPARDFLKDVRSTLQRYEEKENFEISVVFPPELKWRIWDYCDLNFLLEGVMKQFKDTLESGLQQQEANVTLDPDTAHRHLALSEDQKSVGRGTKYQDLPDNPERFEKHCMVLGCERFSLGRHCWEVTVGSEEGWALGVARTSVKRKGKFSASPEAGIWAVRTWKGGYKAFIPSLSSLLPISSGELRRIRVCLNCDGRRVAFFDADTAAPLYTFSGLSFSGETLQPFFWVYEKGCLTVSP